MHKTLLLLTAIAGTLCAADSLTVEKAIQVREPSDLHASPDGTRVAFTVQEPPVGRTSLHHIWMLDTATGEVHQWTTSAKSESSPRWSPDGRFLAFLSDREDTQQLWLMPAAGGEALKLTSAKNSVEQFKWSRDGKTIAFLAAEPRSDAEDKKVRDGDDERVIDADRKPTRLWTIDIATKKIKQVTSGAYVVREFDWMPDGAHFIVTATDQPSVPRRNLEGLYFVSLDDGRFTELLVPKSPFRGIQVSPNGATLALTMSSGDGPGAHDLFLMPLNTRAPKNLTGPVKDRPVQSFQWLNDNELAVLYSNGFHMELDAVGGTSRKLATAGSLDVSQFTVSPQGAVTYVAESAAVLPEVFSGGKAVSHFNAGFSNVALAKAEIFEYKSFDGTSIEAALYRPAGVSNHQPQPLIAMIHGGPAGVWRDRFDALTQLLVARGYTVMQPNIRGSTGYGQKFLASNHADWGGGDFKDVMAGVDDLIHKGVADPNRLGIGGWSYGGYMSEWAITQTDRFKVAVCGAGMADLATEFGTESRSEGDEWYFDTPYENLSGFQKSSPIVYIKNAHTPTLILQGEADTTDPISQSQMLYHGLKRYNVPTEFVVYPREPHGLREQKHIIDRYRRSLDWVDKYLSAPSAPSSTHQQQ